MSGRLVGELVTATPSLRRAGVTKRAVDALLVITEAARDDSRCGSAGQARIAGFVDASARTVSRAVTELADHGLVTVVRKGGGRAKLPALYYVAPVGEWLSALATHAIQDGASSAATGATHDGASSAPPPIGTAATLDGASTRHAEANRRQHAVDHAPSMDGAPPVVPVTTRGAPTDVTTGADGASSPPTDLGPPEETPTVIAAGSRCRRAGCPAPGPCGACADARRADARAVELQAVAAAEDAAAAQHRERQRLAQLPRPGTPAAVDVARRGRAAVDAELAASRARRTPPTPTGPRWPLSGPGRPDVDVEEAS